VRRLVLLVVGLVLRLRGRLVILSASFLISLLGMALLLLFRFLSRVAVSLLIGDAADLFSSMAERPNDYIDTTRKGPIRIANANEQTDAVIESAEAGRSPSDLNDLIGKSNPFSPMGELSMKGLAAENGWDTADWDKLTVGDKAFSRCKQ
jgi:hypothetical protein